MISDTPSPKSTPSGTDAKLSRANSVAALRTERAAGRLRWNWPLVFCFIRFPLLVSCFALAYWAYDITGSEHASALAQAFTRYNAPFLADIICISLLLWRLRHEGLSLKQLVLPTRQHLFRDLLFGILILALTTFIVAIFNILTVISRFLSLQAFMDSVTINPFGLLWHVGITLLVMPVSAGITEELVYRAYALPRLQALTHRRWLAIAIMALGFGLQHVAFSLSDWRLALVSGLSMVLAGVAFGIFYFATRQRLLPLILLHWQFDMLTLGLAPLMLMMILK